MKIYKVSLNEAKGGMFANATTDQFPYVEAAINSLDNNIKWWKENWADVEQLIEQYTKQALKKKDGFSTSGTDGVKITSRFTVFHGHDEEAKDAIWTGPCIKYHIAGVSTGIVKRVREYFGGMHDGHKIFAVDNDLIILFG